MRYRLHTGTVAWLMHRITGILLTLFLMVHIFGSGGLPFLSSSTRSIDVMGYPLTGICILFLAVFHGINGIRLMGIDAGIPARRQGALFLAAVILSGIVFGCISLLILRGMQ